MSEQTNGSQDKNNLESPTLGTVPQLYLDEPTKYLRNGYLPDIALQVIDGNYPRELITDDARRDVESAGGKAMIILVLISLCANYSPMTRTIEASQKQIAHKLGVTRTTVNRCIQVLKNVGLLLDVGVSKYGTRRYAIPLIEGYINTLPTREPLRVNVPVKQPVKQPVNSGVKQGVNYGEHIQDIDIDNNNGDYKKVDEHFEELYSRAVACIPKDLQPKWNKTAAKEFKRVMRYAPMWNAEPELYGQALIFQAGNRSLAGGYLEAMKELEYLPPKQPRVAIEPCEISECDGYLHTLERDGKPVALKCPKRKAVEL